MTTKLTTATPLNQQHMYLVTTSGETYDGLVTVLDDGIHLQVKLGYLMGVQSFKFQEDSVLEVCKTIITMLEKKHGARS